MQHGDNKFPGQIFLKNFEKNRVERFLQLRFPKNGFVTASPSPKKSIFTAEISFVYVTSLGTLEKVERRRRQKIPQENRSIPPAEIYRRDSRRVISQVSGEKSLEKRPVKN